MVTNSQPYTDRCWCVTNSQLPVDVLSVAWHVRQQAASRCTVSSLTCLSASCQLLYRQQPDMSASHCARASSLVNCHQYLTLIQDGYQCSNTFCCVLFLPWWRWWCMISVEYTMWNHVELIWYKCHDVHPAVQVQKLNSYTIQWSHHFIWQLLVATSAHQFTAQMSPSQMINNSCHMQ